MPPADRKSLPGIEMSFERTPLFAVYQQVVTDVASSWETDADCYANEARLTSSYIVDYIKGYVGG